MVYVAGLTTVGFWPTPVDKPIQGTLAAILKYLHSHGVPGWLDYNFVEATANVAMFIPFGILSAMALPAKAWIQLASVGLMASTGLELGQLLFITARFSSLLDVVTNTLGAIIGISTARHFAARKSLELAGVKRSSSTRRADGN
ncbi:VanZ family protein [Paenarthrobacter nicotinovorans]|uniref:VanZ family protein n=1 Tax=Paenarthrobacter nicotinovorans TaxID=29320 RepID=UPI003A800B37